MTRLADVAEGRDNNFNLIRMVAALAVLVSHAFPIALGPGTPEPLEHLTGRSLGGIAVAVFFVISGFLIAESFVRSRSRTDFMVARVLRLWPALLLSLVIVAFLMGPLVTTLGLGTYLTHPGVWGFMVDNTLLATPAYTLPGVFEAQPYSTVEGSIWTLFYEVVCYLGVFVAGVIGLLTRRLWMSLALLAFAALWLAVEVVQPNLHLKIDNMLALGLPFATGTALWLWKDRIVLSIWGVVALWVATVALAATPAYVLVMTLALAYTTFWLAYIPAGAIRAYNRLGDYSYGVYIYAFPAQGLAVWLTGGDAMNPYVNMGVALPLTLIPSILSWHLLEKPALAQRKRVAGWFTGRRAAA